MVLSIWGATVVACTGRVQGPVANDAEVLLDGAELDTGRPDAASVDSGVQVDAAESDAGLSDDCGLPAPADVAASYDRTLYVSVNGSDGNDGASRSSPLATLGVAATRATPGTRIVLTAGTYRGRTNIVDLRGTADRPIAIVGEGEVILDADGGVEVLHFTDVAYLILENVTIQGATGNGLNIDDGGSYETPSANVVLRALTVRDIGTGGNNDCIKLSGVDDFHILDSEISNCSAGSGIDMVGCHDGVISGNFLHDLPNSGIQAKGGSRGTIINGNRFVDIAGRSINAGGSTGLEFFRPIDAPYEAADLSVVANVFVRVGAASGAPIAYVGCDGCRFVNNTVVEPRTWVARILQETTGPRFVPSRDGQFVNNLIAFNVGDLRTFVNVGANTAPETFVFGSNLWWAMDRDPSWPGPSLPGSIPVEMSSVIQQDPALEDLAGGDYRLRSGSPAARAGRTVDRVFPSFDGRCYRNVRSIGAFEAVD